MTSEATLTSKLRNYTWLCTCKQPLALNSLSKIYLDGSLLQASKYKNDHYREGISTYYNA